jgi:hypothetical protein
LILDKFKRQNLTQSFAHQQEESMRFLFARVLFLAIASFLFCSSAAAQNSTPVSGYEIYLGHNCRITGHVGTCGTTFTGWTGIQPTDTGGFLPFPGTGQGVWSLQINYLGQPAFGGTTPQVNVVGGKWSFLYRNGTTKQGTVLNGSVTWPADETSTVPNSFCHAGEALAQTNITITGGQPTVVVGCLHDLPPGSAIPPTVWGFFGF